MSKTSERREDRMQRTKNSCTDLHPEEANLKEEEVSRRVWGRARLTLRGKTEAVGEVD
jgi:hypothetical protein